MIIVNLRMMKVGLLGNFWEIMIMKRFVCQIFLLKEHSN